jgi:hypothetical protein
MCLALRLPYLSFTSPINPFNPLSKFNPIVQVKREAAPFDAAF